MAPLAEFDVSESTIHRSSRPSRNGDTRRTRLCVMGRRRRGAGGRREPHPAFPAGATAQRSRTQSLRGLSRTERPRVARIGAGLLHPGASGGPLWARPALSLLLLGSRARSPDHVPRGHQGLSAPVADRQWRLAPHGHPRPPGKAVGVENRRPRVTRFVEGTGIFRVCDPPSSLRGCPGLLRHER